MIPRAVLMAQEVANIGVPASQGNILFNGTDTAVPNTAGVPAWHWADSAIPPGPLPNLHVFTPALRSWQNTSESYYTRGGEFLVGYNAPFTYWVPQNNAAGAPTWAQPPSRKYSSQRVQYTSTSTPGADGLVDNNIVTELNLGVIPGLNSDSIEITITEGGGVLNPVYYNYYTLESVYVNDLGETICVLPVPYTSSLPPGPGPGNIYSNVTYETQTWTTSYVAPVAPSSAATFPIENSTTEPPIDIVVWP